MDTPTTITNMNKLMASDNISDADQTNIITGFQTILNTPTYVNSIKKNVQNMIVNKKLNLSDIPDIIQIILATNALLSNTLQLKSSIPAQSIKYLVYGLLLKYLDTGDEMDNQAIEELLENSYSTLWTGVSDVLGASIKGIDAVANRDKYTAGAAANASPYLNAGQMPRPISTNVAAKQINNALVRNRNTDVKAKNALIRAKNEEIRARKAMKAAKKK